MTVRINRVAVTLLLGASGLLLCDTGRATQARPLSDRTLALILGSNGPQKGTKTYGCSDAAVTANPNSNDITAANCGSYTNAQVPNPVKTCVSCSGPSTTSFGSDPNGTPLTDLNKTVDCSKSPTTGQPTTLQSVGTCQPTAGTGKASCQGDNNPNMGACPAGNFAVYKQQAIQ